MYENVEIKMQIAMPTARNANIIVLFHNVRNDNRIPKNHRDNDVYMARSLVIKHWYRRWN